MYTTKKKLKIIVSVLSYVCIIGGGLTQLYGRGSLPTWVLSFL